jgi:hypothetical protein
MYLSRERTIFVYVINSLCNYEIDGNKPIFTDGAIDGTHMMLASGGYG